MATNKKQHYVPISYLKVFANPDEHVWKMDRWTGKIEPEGRKNIFFFDHYYRQEWAPKGANSNILEKYFEVEVEPTIHALRRLSAGDTLSEDEAISCLIYVVMQRCRVPAQLDHAVEQMRQLGMSMMKTSDNPRVREAYRQGYHIVMKKQARLDAFGTLVSSTTQSLEVMRWEAIEAHSSSEFVTSDNPVVAVSPTVFPPACPGLAKRSTRVFFPLSPSTALSLSHKEGVSEMVDLENETTELPTMVGRRIITNELVDAQNLMVGLNATSFIVSRSRKVLEDLWPQIQQHDVVFWIPGPSSRRRPRR